jgi:RIP metalloprotease RseP
VVAAIIFAVWLMACGVPRTAPLTPLVIDEDEVALNSVAESPAAAGGLEPGDRILRLGDVDAPTSEQLTEIVNGQVEDRPGEPLVVVVDRGGERVTLRVVPELDQVVGEPEPRGRMGIIVAPPDPEPVGLGPALVGGVKEVGFSIRESFSQIGRVFGPEGVGRVFGLLFNDEERRPDDAASVVGISQQVGATSSAGDWSTILYVFGFVTVFVGLINLVPLPPFDGGHLLTLAIEKVRGKPVDMRTLIPISATVMAFFVMFVGATIFLDVTKPITLP